MGKWAINNKVCLVTGATSGIGLATAKELARDGACVIVVGRSKKESQAVALSIADETNCPKVDYLSADFQSLREVRDLAREFQKRYKRLDVLINNAGVYLKDRQLTQEGLELTFTVNYLAPFLLTDLLLPILKKSAPARIINVSSNSHRGLKIDLDDLMTERAIDHPKTAYGKSKLALLMFTYQLAEKLAGTHVDVNAICPGGVATNIWQCNNDLATKAFRLAVPLLKTPEQAAELIIYLVKSPELEGVSGKFFALQNHLKYIKSDLRKTERQSSPESYDTQIAQELWKASEELCEKYKDF